VLIRGSLLEEDREERPVPIQKPASGGLSHIPLPVSDDINHPSVVVKFIVLALTEYLFIH
jgi:hypothetical protein